LPGSNRQKRISRDRISDEINAALHYGFADQGIKRAAIGRAALGSSLIRSLWVFRRNRSTHSASPMTSSNPAASGFLFAKPAMVQSTPTTDHFGGRAWAVVLGPDL